MILFFIYIFIRISSRNKSRWKLSHMMQFFYKLFLTAILYGIYIIQAWCDDSMHNPGFLKMWFHFLTLFNIVQYFFLWNWSNTWNVYSELWMLMAWCFSTNQDSHVSFCSVWFLQYSLAAFVQFGISYHFLYSWYGHRWKSGYGPAFLAVWLSQWMCIINSYVRALSKVMLSASSLDFMKLAFTQFLLNFFSLNFSPASLHGGETKWLFDWQ